MIHNIVIGVGTLKGTGVFSVSLGAGRGQDFPLITVGRETYIVGGSVHLSPEAPEVANIHVGSFCSIATDLTLLTGRISTYHSVSSSAHLGSYESSEATKRGQILIRNDVWIGHHVTIMPGVTIANGAVVAAGTVVSADVPPYAIVGGNPQRIIRYRFDPDQIKKMLDVAWWNWSYEQLEQCKPWFAHDIDTFIDHFHAEVEKKEVADALRLEKKTKALLFFLDAYDPYPVWQHVLTDYRRSFTARDDVSLIVSTQKARRVGPIPALLEGARAASEPDILILRDEIMDEQALLSHADYFITSRSKDTVDRIESAERANVRVLSGVDRPVFPRELVEEIRAGVRSA